MIPLARQRITIEMHKGMAEVVASGWWAMGKVTKQLEEEFAKFKKVRHAVAVSSGSAALFLAIAAGKEIYPNIL